MVKIPIPSEASDYVYTNRQNLIDRYINNILYLLRTECYSNCIHYEVPKEIIDDIAKIFSENGYNTKKNACSVSGITTITITW